MEDETPVTAPTGVAEDVQNKLSTGSEAPAGRSILQRVVRGTFSRYATVLLLILLIVIFSFAASNFATLTNVRSLLITQSVTACVTFAALAPLVTGEFDLSLGYLLGFIVMLGAWLSGRNFNGLEVVIVMLVAGVAVGIANGLFTVRFKISSFIATLGVGIVLSGLTLGLSGGQTLYQGIPNVVITLGRENSLGVANAVWITLAIGVLLYVLFDHTPAGRRWYATGGSERVAFMAGVRTDAVKLIAFGLAGLLVGVGAVLALGQAGAASPTFGSDYLLPAYAAAFLGVTTYKPGYYNVVGATVAVVLLAVGFNGLSLLGAPFWVQPVFNGSVLLVAVLTARRESRKVRVG